MIESAKKWQSLEITVPPEAVEAVEFALNSLDALGTAINQLRRANAETITVIGYFNELPGDQTLQDELHYALRVYDLNEEAIHSVTRGEIESADWLHEWKKHWKPTTVGGFVIAPPWETVDEPDKIVIRIEPNMAFGTGTHETTRLCLASIEKFYTPGDSFLDVGTGTGILAIAAAKLNLKSEISNLNAAKLNLKSEILDLKLLACDTDTDSVKIAKENAEANGVADAIDFYEGSISGDTPTFDFVCANLTIDVILPILPLLLVKTAKTLVLSGILSEQESLIVEALGKRAVESKHVVTLGEWISVIVRKN